MIKAPDGMNDGIYFGPTADGYMVRIGVDSVFQVTHDRHNESTCVQRWDTSRVNKNSVSCTVGRTFIELVPSDLYATVEAATRHAAALLAKVDAPSGAEGA